MPGKAVENGLSTWAAVFTWETQKFWTCGFRVVQLWLLQPLGCAPIDKTFLLSVSPTVCVTKKKTNAFYLFASVWKSDKDREIVHLLAHSLNAYNSQGWACPESGAPSWSPLWITWALVESWIGSGGAWTRPSTLQWYVGIPSVELIHFTTTHALIWPLMQLIRVISLRYMNLLLV